MKDLDPSSIELETLSKSFTYEKIARELDESDNIDEIRDAAKCFVKLYLKTTEAMRGL